MRPARIIAAVTLVAAAAGSYFAVSTAHRSAAAPTAPVTAPLLPPTLTHPVDLPQPPGPTSPGPIDRVPAPRSVLADGRYDSYIRTVDTGRGRLVVDLVQVFEGQAAVDAAITDGMARDQAQYLNVYVRNQNPRLRTLQLASDARLMSGSIHTYYFTLTVTGGAVHEVQEILAINAC
jgi:hypothetical protein